MLNLEPVVFAAALSLGAAVLVPRLSLAAENEFYAMDNGIRDVKSIADKAALLNELGYDGVTWRPGTTAEALKEMTDQGVKMHALMMKLEVAKKEAAPALPLKDIEALKGTGAILWVQLIRKGGDDADAARELKRLNDVAKRMGLRIAIYPHINCHVETLEEAMRVTELVADDNVGVSLTLCHQLKLQGVQDLDYAGPIGLIGFGIKQPAKQHLKQSITFWKASSVSASSTPFSVADLHCEDLVDPLGIETATPRFSWRMLSSAQGAAQGAYQVLCATKSGLLESGKADLWDTGKVASDSSRFVTYAGKEIKRGMPCYWAVRIWNENDKASAWSKPGVWTYAGLASDSDWEARWITDNTSSPWLRQMVELKTIPAGAYIYVNAIGYFQLFINGKRVGDDEFAPHVGQYNKRTFCITYDVTEYLKKGRNAVGFWLGSGWSRGGAGVKLAPAVRAQLEMLDAGGETTTLTTDETWRAKASSMSYRGGWCWNNFGGEVHTGSEDLTDWADSDYDDSGWPNAKPAKVADTIVSSEMVQRSRVIETVTPVKVTNLNRDPGPTDIRVAGNEKVEIRIKKALYGIPGKPDQQVDIREKLQRMAAGKKYAFKMTNAFAGKDPALWTEKVLLLEYELNGKSISRRINENDDVALVVVGTPAQGGTTTWLVDMGKAMTGTFEITFPKANKGHKVSMEFGDSYNPGSNGQIGKLNSFRQASEYICRGSGDETFKNRFNYASCRYILIRNAPEGELTPENVKGHFITTDLPKASTFSCSDETLNAIYKMMEHTLRCLMLGGYQVDCHSRERYGYGGDGHSSLDTTLCFLRSGAFYRKWTRDWLDGQKGDGGLTYTSPASGHGGGPFWCGFLTAATLKHYHHYGDLSLVKRNYPAIKKWFELAQRKTVDDLQEKFCGGWYLGDWASPKGTNDKGNAEVFIHAYMAYALEQAAQLADALGVAADSGTFRQWAAARNVATHKKFYDPQLKRYGSGDQVTYVLPLIAGVVPADLRDGVFVGFEEALMVKNKGHLSTGLSGTYMMVQYLQGIGRDELIYSFASKRTYPSWGYMIENGATATWEHWSGRASRIHNCYNNIGSWFIQGLAGIRPDPRKPGFKNAIIRPAFVEQLSYVNGSHDSVYGTIQSNWKREGEAVIMTVIIPANSTATVYVPAAAANGVTVNGQPVTKADHVTFLRMEEDRAVLAVRSGNYELVGKRGKL